MTPDLLNMEIREWCNGRPLCGCGCGQHPKLAESRYLVGHQKGQPFRYGVIEGVHYDVDPETGCWNWKLFKNAFEWVKTGYCPCCGKPLPKAASSPTETSERAGD